MVEIQITMWPGPHCERTVEEWRETAYGSQADTERGPRKWAMLETLVLTS